VSVFQEVVSGDEDGLEHCLAVVKVLDAGVKNVHPAYTEEEK
jgi:hypothetical protein